MLLTEPNPAAGVISTREPEPILGLDLAFTIARKLALTATDASLVAPALLRIIICAVGLGDILPTFFVFIVTSFGDLPFAVAWLPYLDTPPRSSIVFFYCTAPGTRNDVVTVCVLFG